MTKKTPPKTVKPIATKKSSDLKTALKAFGYLFPETEEEYEAFEEIYGNTEIELPEYLKDLNFLNKKMVGNTGRVISLHPSQENSISVTAYAAREGQDTLPDSIKKKMAIDKRSAVEKMNNTKAAKKK